MGWGLNDPVPRRVRKEVKEVAPAEAEAIETTQTYIGNKRSPVTIAWNPSSCHSGVCILLLPALSIAFISLTLALLVFLCGLLSDSSFLFHLQERSLRRDFAGGSGSLASVNAGGSSHQDKSNDLDEFDPSSFESCDMSYG